MIAIESLGYLGLGVKDPAALENFATEILGLQSVVSDGQRTLRMDEYDRMLFYLRTPSGFEIEYGWGGREVDDATRHVQKHHAPSIWGHRRAMR